MTVSYDCDLLSISHKDTYFFLVSQFMVSLTTFIFKADVQFDHSNGYIGFLQKFTKHSNYLPILFLLLCVKLPYTRRQTWTRKRLISVFLFLIVFFVEWIYDYPTMSVFQTSEILTFTLEKEEIPIRSVNPGI